MSCSSINDWPRESYVWLVFAHRRIDNGAIIDQPYWKIPAGSTISDSFVAAVGRQGREDVVGRGVGGVREVKEIAVARAPVTAWGTGHQQKRIFGLFSIQTQDYNPSICLFGLQFTYNSSKHTQIPCELQNPALLHLFLPWLMNSCNYDLLGVLSIYLSIYYLYTWKLAIPGHISQLPPDILRTRRHWFLMHSTVRERKTAFPLPSDLAYLPGDTGSPYNQP